jgi:hypothetical protein
VVVIIVVVDAYKVHRTEKAGLPTSNCQLHHVTSPRMAKNHWIGVLIEVRYLTKYSSLIINCIIAMGKGKP